jgi:hypothetical protein
MDSLWGPHSMDRFATQGNSYLPRYNFSWRDPISEAVDCLHLPDNQWTAETNLCNPPWTLLPDLVHKLRQSGAEAAVIAPYWPAKQWYQLLSELSDEQIMYPLFRDLIFPGKRGAYEGVGSPGWSVTAFHVPPRLGSTEQVVNSTQHRPTGRPRPYLCTPGHPRTTVTKPHL